MDADHRVGDKVAVKNRGTPLRGVIVEVQLAMVRVQASSATVDVDLDDVTNYSAAARKAWLTRPHRRVGRPRGAVVDRVTVNLRVDRDLWTAFQTAEINGLIAARTKTINKWLREGLRRLQRGSRQ